jgi:hypothetical protein
LTVPKVCPTCSKYGITSSFCSQLCFKANWDKHKKIHATHATAAAVAASAAATAASEGDGDDGSVASSDAEPAEPKQRAERVTLPQVKNALYSGEVNEHNKPHGNGRLITTAGRQVLFVGCWENGQPTKGKIPEVDIDITYKGCVKFHLRGAIIPYGKGKMTIANSETIIVDGDWMAGNILTRNLAILNMKTSLNRYEGNKK